MVKGISRQVIVVDAPDPKLFEQAIFILREESVGVTDEALLKEASRLVRNANVRRYTKRVYTGPLWACGGAFVTGILWMVTLMF